MGVHGLWKLLEPVGKVVPLEGMAGKVLAVDVSIWLHQAIKGMHDSHGAPLAVAHLLILFHRLCKLLFYKIKPVFVFDGGVPALKRETMSVRRQFRSAAKSEALKVRGKLLKNLLKHEAVRQMLSRGHPSEILGLSSLALPGSSVEEELYRLPPVAEEFSREKSDEEEEASSEDGDAKFADDIHSIDVTSSDFKSLPADVRHEILLELIETRKQSSWKNLDKMPKDSDNFSDFQMSRLLKRRAVQTSLDEAGKEMGGRSMSMKDLEDLLLNRDTPIDDDTLPGKRIAQDDVTRYVLAYKDDVAEVEESKPENELGEPSEQELTQREIYDIIKKENQSNGCESRIPAAVESTKLTAEPKINLTEDVKEILPLLNTGNIKIENVEEEERVNIENPVEVSVKMDRTEECSRIEKETISVEVNDRVQTNEVESISTNFSIQSQSPKEKSELASPIAEAACSAREESESATGVKEESTSESFPGRSNDNAQSSDESETDFVDVPSGPSSVNWEFGPDVETVSTPKSGRPGGMELVVDTTKNEDADDIFADIFKSSREETSPSEKEFVEGVANDAEDVDDVPVEGCRTETDLRDLQKSVESECFDLIQEQGKQERVAQSISEQMNLDAQELLRLFGVPYVVAPMEAEAQCAVLNIIGLTDGTITDDSDIWLFGGRIVYRNFFNHKKHVLEYKSQDIERSFKLTREDLIKLAMLVGSDYTSGLDGIGPVTALEILGAFPGTKSEEVLSGLKSFRDWVSGGCESGSATRALRRKLKSTKLIPGFPSQAVLDAYLHPQTDDSREPFSWAKPNVSLLEKYAKTKFGWSQEKCAELLTPVMKRLADNKKDTTLDKYFSVLKDPLPRGTLSKRVENAVKRLKSERSVVQVDTDESEPEKKRAKKSKAKHTTGETEKQVVARPKLEASSPQKLAMERMLEERKKNAIKIFKGGNKKTTKRKNAKKTVAVKEVNLSESSSDDN